MSLFIFYRELGRIFSSIYLMILTLFVKAIFLKNCLATPYGTKNCTLLPYLTAGKSRAEVYKFVVPYLWLCQVILLKKWPLFSIVPSDGKLALEAKKLCNFDRNRKSNAKIWIDQIYSFLAFKPRAFPSDGTLEPKYKCLGFVNGSLYQAMVHLALRICWGSYDMCLLSRLEFKSRLMVSNWKMRV